MRESPNWEKPMWRASFPSFFIAQGLKLPKSRSKSCRVWPGLSYLPHCPSGTSEPAAPGPSRTVALRTPLPTPGTLF